MTTFAPVTAGLVVVTAAAGGMAGSLVPRLAAHGWRLALTSRPGGERETTQRYEELAADGAELRTFGIDLADPASVSAGFAKIKAEMGAPTALVNLAGRFEGGPAADAGPDAAAVALERSLDSNLRSAVYSAAAVLPDMLAAGAGAIVAVGAAAAIDPAPKTVAYAAGKGALAAYFRSLAAQVAGNGVSVGLLLPLGALDTPGNRAAMPKADPDKWISAEAFCDAVEFLLSRPPRGFVHELPLGVR